MSFTRLRWPVIIFLYTTLLYCTVPFVPVLRKALVERYGYSVYNYVYPILILLGLAALFQVLRKQQGAQKLVSLAGLCLTACTYALILPHLQYGVEKIHFLEYGFLAFLFMGAFHKYVFDLMLFPWCILLVYIVGLGDETLQSFTPNRVAEISDVTLNVYSGMLGLVATIFAMPAWRPKRVTERLSLFRFLHLSIVSMVLTVLFLYFIHGFGSRINDPEAGVFYSSFDPEKLLSLNRDVEQKKEVGKSEKTIYENEGFRHLFQRDFYDTNKFYIAPGQFYVDYNKSMNENRLVEKYYGGYLSQVNRQWPANHPRSAPGQYLPWESRVKSTLITKVTLRQVLLASFFLVLALGSLRARLGRKWVAHHE